MSRLPAPVLAAVFVACVAVLVVCQRSMGG
jgi:hypothetical protein